MALLDVREIDYPGYSNRQLLAVPLAVLFVALLIIGGWYVMTGSPVNPGLEFTGGTELRLAVDDADGQPREQIRDAFSQEPETIQSNADGTYTVTFQSTDVDALRSQAIAAFGEDGYRSGSVVSPSFGSRTLTLALAGIAVAFAGMSVVVFVLFRSLVPCVAVLASALSDILIPLAVMNLLGIELSLGTIVALLMLIGYSVDSDILLNDHVLRRPGDFYESVYRAMRTGVTMTLTSLSAMAVMAVVARLFGIELLASIGIVLVFGLLADLMNTYMMNLSLLRWYKYEGIAR